MVIVVGTNPFATGFRRLAADVAWIELLQEVGDVGRVDESDINYPNLKLGTLRIMRIDPYFHSATMFGAVTLAWIRTINRPDEALEVLQEGIRANPTYWPFQILVASLGFMRADEFDKMCVLLQDAIKDPECPAITKVILANAYKSHGRIAEAMAIWKMILDLPSARDYHQRALQQIQLLESKTP
jgi:hypothetical protein